MSYLELILWLTTLAGASPIPGPNSGHTRHCRNCIPTYTDEPIPCTITKTIPWPGPTGPVTRSTIYAGGTITEFPRIDCLGCDLKTVTAKPPITPYNMARIGRVAPPMHDVSTVTVRCATTVTHTVCLPSSLTTRAPVPGITRAPMRKVKQKRHGYCTSTSYTSPTTPAPTKTVWGVTERTRKTVDCAGCKFLSIAVSPGLVDPATEDVDYATVTRDGTTTVEDYKCFITQAAGYDIPVQGPKIMGVEEKMRRAGVVKMDEYVDEGDERDDEEEDGEEDEKEDEEEDPTTVITRKFPCPSIPRIPPMPTKPPVVSRVVMHLL